jgi:hypothetical protein
VTEILNAAEDGEIPWLCVSQMNMEGHIGELRTHECALKFASAMSKMLAINPEFPYPKDPGTDIPGQLEAFQKTVMEALPNSCQDELERSISNPDEMRPFLHVSDVLQPRSRAARQSADAQNRPAVNKPSDR